MNALVYDLQNGRPGIDCPRCGQAVRVDRHGSTFRFKCYGGCTDDELTGLLDPAVMLELASGVSWVGEWLEGAPMDPTAEAAEPLPTLAGFPFLHPATAAVVSGPTGGGRSSLIQACAYDAASGGRTGGVPGQRGHRA